MAPPAERWLDRLGVAAGSLCALHCLLAVVAPAAFVVAGIGHDLGALAEWSLTAGPLALGTLGAWACWQQGERTRGRLFLVLMATLVSARALDHLGLGQWGEPLAVGAGLGLAWLHLCRCQSR